MEKQLAIMGHQTRGKEVIEILQMLGGEKTTYGGESIYNIYYLENSKDIISEYYLKTYLTDLAFEVFTLEEFLEKYPYKVGDKVISTYYSDYGNIVKMAWDSNNCCMKYNVKLENSGFIARFKWFTHNEIKLMDDIDSETCEMMCEDALSKICRIFISDKDYQDKVELCLGDEYEMVVENGRTFLQKKKFKYPTTYYECCKVLDTDCTAILRPGYKYRELEIFQRILICRDAYWKIAGEEMGLGKSWEPDWTKSDYKFCTINMKNKIVCDDSYYISKFLAFPTAEMRDGFFENFKDLINDCKEFL